MFTKAITHRYASNRALCLNFWQGKVFGKNRPHRRKPRPPRSKICRGLDTRRHVTSWPSVEAVDDLCRNTRATNAERRRDSIGVRARVSRFAEEAWLTRRAPVALEPGKSCQSAAPTISGETRPLRRRPARRGSGAKADFPVYSAAHRRTAHRPRPHERGQYRNRPRPTRGVRLDERKAPSSSAIRPTIHRFGGPTRLSHLGFVATN